MVPWSSAAREVKTAPVLLYDVPGNPKAKPGPDIRLGRKKGFKEIFPGVHWNSASSIEDRDPASRTEVSCSIRGIETPG